MDHEEFAQSLAEAVKAISLSCKQVLDALDEFSQALAAISTHLAGDSQVIGVCAPKNY